MATFFWNFYLISYQYSKEIREFKYSEGIKNQGGKMDNYYWEEHYKTGGDSGEGSVGQLRDWKWSIIKKYCPDLDNVIDVGCGDLSFWEGKTCKNYIGIDKSQTIIEKNRKERPEWKFFCCSADEKLQISINTVFCLDVLFHILDDDEFNRIIDNFISYSDEYIFIFTWIKNPFQGLKKFKMALVFFKQHNYNAMLKTLLPKSNTDGIYQKYRDFSDYVEYLRLKRFECIGVDHNFDIYPYGAMYIFQKVKK